MEFWDFMHNHFILAFFIICSTYYLIRCFVVRILRSINIATRGWPPEHLDADGDFKPEKET